MIFGSIIETLFSIICICALSFLLIGLLLFGFFIIKMGIKEIKQQSEYEKMLKK